MIEFKNLTPRRAFIASALAATLAAGLSKTVIAAPASTPPRKAPPWDIAEWINGDGGNVDTHKGKVIVIDFFQLWCPGCLKFSIPLMNYWEKQVFADQVKKGRLAFISIHTVFEGHGYQTPKKLRRFVKEKEIVHPVGIDRHRGGSHTPVTMRRYRTRGTPEMAIIDKKGMIRFQNFGFFEPPLGEHIIRTLLEE